MPIKSIANILRVIDRCRGGLYGCEKPLFGFLLAKTNIYLREEKLLSSPRETFIFAMIKSFHGYKNAVKVKEKTAFAVNAVKRTTIMQISSEAVFKKAE